MNKREFYKQSLLKWIIRKRKQKQKAIRKSFADHDNMQKAYKVAFQWKAVRTRTMGSHTEKKERNFSVTQAADLIFELFWH
jgi:hypothetical protein